MALSNADIAALLAAGIPLAGERGSSASAIDFAAVKTIVVRALAESSEPKVRDAVRGWLIAIRDHYPSIFGQYFHHQEIIDMLSTPVTGRDIKLRRLALAHLGKIV